VQKDVAHIAEISHIGLEMNNQHIAEKEERLEGLYNIDLMRTFIETYHAIVEDIQNEEPFETSDIKEFLIKKLNQKKG